MKSFLPIIQIIIAIFLVISILFQQRGTALGSAFGGSSESYGTRRGIQKNLLWITVVLGTVFIILSLLNLIVK